MGEQWFPRSLMTTGFAVGVLWAVNARTFDMKYLGAQGSSDGNNRVWLATKTKCAFYQLKIGSASKNDDMSEMEIRAATVMKNVKDRKVAVNDVASLKFEPKNVGKPIFFEIKSGTSCQRVDRDRWYSDYSYGWQLAGCQIEIWQGDKVVKTWSGAKGLPSGFRLDRNVRQMRLNDKGCEVSQYGTFENGTEIYSTTGDRKRVDLEDVMAQFVDGDDAEKPENASDDKSAAEKDGKATLASPEDFNLKKFCGYEFGSPKGESAFGGGIRLQRPFRHYEWVRLRFGSHSERLVGIMLESRRAFSSPEDRDVALAEVAAIFEKKYGITLQASGQCYYFSNEYVSIQISSSFIQVTSLTESRRDRRLSEQSLEAARKRGGMTKESSDADVL